MGNKYYRYRRRGPGPSVTQKVVPSIKYIGRIDDEAETKKSKVSWGTIIFYVSVLIFLYSIY